jgi:hypothetical protein
MEKEYCMNQIRSGYVCAGFETLSSTLFRFMRGDSTGENSRFDDHYSVASIRKMIPQIISGVLHSFGQDFPDKKKLHQYVEKEAKVYRTIKNEEFLADVDAYVDSGGYQVACGRVSKEKTIDLINLYHEFIVDHVDLYDKAFVLDLPPGPDCVIYDNWDEVYDMNYKTYNMAAELPDKVRKKMTYVQHFRTPKQWEIFNKIKNENNLFDKFDYHATGGVVANLQSDMIIPCISYVLPLIPLLNDCIKFKRKKLNFHVLGGSNFRDIMFYEMFRKHVDEMFEIELNITYDSSGLFKSLMQGRQLYILDENSNSVKKTDIKSNRSNKRFYNTNMTTDQYLIAKLNKMADKFDIKKLDLAGIYSRETNTLYDDFRAYAMLYMLDFYSEMQTVIREHVNNVYPIYKNGEIAEFNHRNINFTKYLNSGKMTKKQTVKTSVLAKSLTMLSNLDEDYCKHLVDTFMAKDEVIKLGKKNFLMKC